MRTEEHPRPKKEAPRAISSHARPIEVHIEELVLHGFAPADRHRIAEVVEQELARLLREGMAVSSAHARLDRIDVGAFQVKAGAKAQATGALIAQAVFRGLQESVGTPSALPLSRPVSGGRTK